VRSYP